MRFVHAAGVCLLYLGLANCAGGPAEPTGPALLGRWGTAESEQVVLAADSAATVVIIGCTFIRTTKLVELAADGTFAFRGTYSPSGPIVSGPKPLAEVTGVVQGNTVELTYDVLGDGQRAQSVSLQRGVEPPFDFACPL